MFVLDVEANKIIKGVGEIQSNDIHSICRHQMVLKCEMWTFPSLLNIEGSYTNTYYKQSVKVHSNVWSCENLALDNHPISAVAP